MPKIPTLPRRTVGSGNPPPPHWHAHFTFLVGPCRTQFQVRQSLILRCAGSTFHEHCAILAEQCLAKRINFSRASKPVFAVFLRILEGTSPPTTLHGWMSEARQPNTTGRDWEAVEMYPETNGDALEQKSMGEYALELYNFVKENNIRSLSRQIRQYALAAVYSKGVESIPAIACAMETLARESTSTRSDKLIRALVRACKKTWLAIPADVKTQLPSRFLQMVLRKLINTKSVVLVGNPRHMTGSVRMYSDPGHGLPSTSAEMRAYLARQQNCIQRDWETNDDLVKLCDWFKERKAWEWRMDAELDAMEGALLEQGNARLYMADNGEVETEETVVPRWGAGVQGEGPGVWYFRSCEGSVYLGRFGGY
ncbi:hypothetical protein PMIN06_001981 [Paraphaeosphaeria minitans]